MNLNCIIVDDEPLALELLESYVSRTPFLRLIGKCNNAVEALTLMERESIQLAFLDIQMPEVTGMELSKMIKHDTKIIFTTAFEQYALEGFKVDAIDYLLKPFTFTEFLKAANKALSWFERTVPSLSQVTREPESIFIKSEYKLIQLDVRKILYIEGLKDYIKIHTEEHERPILTLMSMKSIDKYLTGSTFARVHRSYIVNINKIKTIDRNRIVFGKVYIPISDTYKEHLFKLLEKRSPS